jgi:hypothetical protein
VIAPCVPEDGNEQAAMQLIQAHQLVHVGLR